MRIPSVKFHINPFTERTVVLRGQADVGTWAFLYTRYSRGNYMCNLL